jgi:ABC-type nitrate/sulfonate/bicarbonate transport system permease component
MSALAATQLDDPATAEPARPPAGGHMRARAGEFALRWTVLIGLLMAWELAARNAGSVYFAEPSRFLARAAELWLPSGGGILTDSLRGDVLPSLARMAAGLSLAVVAAIVLGVAIGLSRSLGDYVDPLIQFARAIPPPALLPIFLVLFGRGDAMRVLLIAFGTSWPILLNTVEGVRSIDPVKYATAKVFRIPFRDRLLRIVLPGAAQKILAGVRTSLALALILMVISEMVASTGGIGFHIVQAQRGFQILDMWAGIFLLGVLGYLLNLLLTVVERRVLVWRRATDRETA